MVTAAPFSFAVGMSKKDSKILTHIPIIAEIKMALSFDKALKTWKPNILDKLTIKISGAVIISGSVALSKVGPKKSCTISLDKPTNRIIKGIDKPTIKS